MLIWNKIFQIRNKKKTNSKTHLESTMDANSSHSNKKQSLASMYRPPIELIFKGTFEAVSLLVDLNIYFKNNWW